MDSLLAKKEWILDQEQRFARELAGAVIDLPRMSLWMILIPIILVFHVNRHKSAVKGRSEFVTHYMLSRSRSLEEAFGALAENRPPDIHAVVAKAVDLPEAARPAYEAWIRALIGHYLDLLRASGGDLEALVIAAYRNRSNYLLHLNQMNQLEKALNVAVKNHVADNAQSVAETIARMETCSAELRRLHAEAIFP